MSRIKVLVITRNAWDDTNSIGNTMSNFFCSAKDVTFANLYFRASEPNNAVCSLYYHVTEQDMLRHLLSPERCGAAFERAPVVREREPAFSREKKLVSWIHSTRLKSAYVLSDKLWDSERWINGRLAAFIESFQPDMVFTFAKSAPQYYHSIRLLHEKYHIPVKLWIADDEYTALSLSNKKKDKERVERLRYILGCASAVWGCSQEICDYYNGVFGCSAAPLYKTCTFDYPVHTVVQKPLHIMYAGNLQLGRLEMLRRLAKKLAALPKDCPRAVLDIYSNTPMPSADIELFKATGAAVFHGAKPHAEIQRIMSQSELVLHIESFDAKDALKTKYSFSTKIIDCLQSGSVLLTVGPPFLASVRYSRQIPGAFVIDDEARLEQDLEAVLRDSESLPSRAGQIRKFASANHSPNTEWLRK